jgi:hypothetical protein
MLWFRDLRNVDLFIVGGLGGICKFNGVVSTDKSYLTLCSPLGEGAVDVAEKGTFGSSSPI